MLSRGPNVKVDSACLQEGSRFCGVNAGFAVNDEIFERSKNVQPCSSDGRAEIRCGLALELLSGVPSVGFIEHVPDQVGAIEHDVCLDILVLFRGHLK